LIPYPLSTGPNCGDLIYYSFDCNSSTGQVSFKWPLNGMSYRVTSINSSARTFVIQLKQYDDNPEARNSRGNQLNPPFKLINWFNADELIISWEIPKEPSCNSSRDCKDWPNSTCNSASDGKKRCLCNRNFRWDGLNLNCSTKG